VQGPNHALDGTAEEFFAESRLLTRGTDMTDTLVLMQSAQNVCPFS